MVQYAYATGDSIDPGAPAPDDQNDKNLSDANQPPLDAHETPAPEEGWEFHAENGQGGANAAPMLPIEPVSWTASEYIGHQKNAGWFMGLGVAIALMFDTDTYVVARRPHIAYISCSGWQAFGTLLHANPRYSNTI